MELKKKREREREINRSQLESQKPRVQGEGLSLARLGQVFTASPSCWTRDDNMQLVSSTQ